MSANKKKYQIIFGQCIYCNKFQKHLLINIGKPTPLLINFENPTENHMPVETELCQYMTVCSHCGFNRSQSDFTLKQYLQGSDEITFFSYY